MKDFYQPLNFSNTPTKSRNNKPREYKALNYLKGHKWLFEFSSWFKRLVNGLNYILPFILLTCLISIYLKLDDLSFLDVSNEIVIGLLSTIAFIVIIVVRGVIETYEYSILKQA